MSNNNPTSLADLYPGRFLKAGHLMHKGRDYFTLTIAQVFTEELDGDKGKERKAILAFRETSQQHVMPKINAQCVAAMLGNDVRQWVGKRISLYATDRYMPFPGRTGEDRFCVRVYGSPEIDKPIAVEFRPPRRKAIRMTMQPTGNAASQPKQAPKPQPPAEAAPKLAGEALAKHRKRLRAKAGEFGNEEAAEAAYRWALRQATGRADDAEVHLAELTEQQARAAYERLRAEAPG